MAVGLTQPDSLLPIRGIRLAAGACGIKANQQSDLVLIVADEGTQSAAVFTKNAYCAAPVKIARDHMEQATSNALLINSGNANAGTGEQGEEHVRQLCARVASELGFSSRQVLPFSTGVISEPLPVESMLEGIQQLVPRLSENSWLEAATAIMTTDTVAKGVSSTCVIDGEQITITGIAKGSGMIHPNMATMLSFVATDAAVDPFSLRQLIQTVTDESFNCITVDGDTSTNDAFVLMASSVARNRLLSPSHPEWDVFARAIENVSIKLAQSIIRDGEGATRFIEMRVTGGATIEDCKQVGFTVANSPLVKTAFFAGDPNLGRILAAIGRSKIDALNMQTVSLLIGDLPVVEKGEPSPQYDEQQAADIMAHEDVVLHIDLGMGEEHARVWTTDLSFDYVKINSEYRS